MYVDRKPSLYLEDLRHDFKNSLSKFENGDEAFDTLLGFVDEAAHEKRRETR